MRQALFVGNGRPGYSEAQIETVKDAILDHDECKSYMTQVSDVLEGWRETHEPLLQGLEKGDNPRDIIRILSEDLLARFSDLPLLDSYDIFQRLMDYWAEVMQDDLYLIADDGWAEAAKPRGIIEDKEKRSKRRRI